VVIRQLDLEELESEHAVLRVECSKGTYIRVLAEDIGRVLGCGAHLAALQRLAAGPFTLGEAVGMDALEALSHRERLKRLLPSETLLGSRPRLVLTEPAAAKFRQGQAVSVNSDSGSVAVFGDRGAFIGAGEVDAQGLLRPQRLIAQHPA
jgi:tRNA pseudouridine55 synthase